MRYFVYTNMFLLAFWAGSQALADDGPFITRRPGLWLQTINGPSPKVLRECTDLARDMVIWKERLGRIPPSCTEVYVKRNKSGGTTRLVCQLPGQTRTTETTIERKDDLSREMAESYRLTTHAEIEPHPAALLNGITVTMDGRWIGSCPADMKPGDTWDAAGGKPAHP